MTPTAEPPIRSAAENFSGESNVRPRPSRAVLPGENVDGIVPGVGNQAGALNFAAIVSLGSAHDGLDYDGGDQRPDGVGAAGMRGVVRQVQRFESDEHAGGGQQHSYHERAQCFQPAVTVGMLGVGWFGRDDQAQQNQPGCENIAGRFNTVRYGGCGRSVETDGDLRGRQASADEHAGDGDAAASELWIHLRLFLT